MKRLGFLAVCLLLAALIVADISIYAQDNGRRVRPAFPIGSGEKMLVVASGVPAANSYGGGTPAGGYSKTSTSELGTIIPIHLPVGTTLKRVLGDFVDQTAGGANLTIELYRVSSADMNTIVILRSFTTSGITSSNSTDFKQVVGNPLSHVMLQGWTYFIRVHFPGGTSTNELVAGPIKLIYEP